MVPSGRNGKAEGYRKRTASQRSHRQRPQGKTPPSCVGFSSLVLYSPLPLLSRLLTVVIVSAEDDFCFLRFSRPNCGASFKNSSFTRKTRIKILLYEFSKIGTHSFRKMRRNNERRMSLASVSYSVFTNCIGETTKYHHKARRL